MEKKVKRLHYSEMVDMGGIPVRQPLPSRSAESIDPFLLLHHHQSIINPGTHPLNAGVGPHPHRGFSPVTFIYKGDVNHRDSRGNNSIVNAGGVQWMNAGMGIIHSERPSPQLAETGGEQEIVQLWINTPAKDKMQSPAYYALQSEEIPVVVSDEGKTRIKVVAGVYDSVTGFTETNSPLLILDISMQAGSNVVYSVPDGYACCIYNFDGVIDIGSFGMVEPLFLVEFNQEGNFIEVNSRENTRLLLLAGKPLNEPVVSYGPFVLNNQTQVMQAIRDYQMGKMGVLIEE